MVTMVELICELCIMEPFQELAWVTWRTTMGVELI